MGAAGRLLRLPAAERRLLAEAAGTLLLVRLLLVLLPFPKALRLLRLRLDGGPAPEAACDPAGARAVARAVERAGRGLPIGAVCLHKAAASALMLRRRGLAAEVRFGVRRRDGAIEAHAWTLSGAEPVSGVAEAKDFSPIATFRA